MKDLASALASRYRIERELGAGGMATVYLASDLKHDRQVAIKVLKPELAAVLGAERFIVEIKTTAALQHPHILPLFDSGEADGFLYYVMPYIQGETIRDKLNRETQCGVDEAVRIAREVADALDYAHRHGVIHRDIKPENILLHDGRAMVMDFGIALAVSAAAGGRMTETGLSLGTPHYMSPEQATAEKEISGRSDIYSLGSVLYEMLAGEPPHLGGSAQQIIMKIITEPSAPVTKLRKSVPPNVAAAVAKALEKLPADRFDTAKGFADALSNAAFVSGSQSSTAAHSGAPAMRSWFLDWRSRAAVGALVVSVVVSLVAGIGSRRLGTSAPMDDPPAVVSRLSFAAGDRVAGSVVDGGNADRPSRTALALSPDGRVLVFVGERGGVRQLFARALSAESAVPIPGTEGAESPFFAPDGHSVGYWSAGRLMRVGVSGGQPAQVAVAARISGASWSEDDRIVFGGGAGLVIVSANGGAPPDTIKGRMTLPQFLPGAEAILFAGRRGVDVINIKTQAITHLVDDGTDPRFLSTGHLIFGRSGTLMAVPLDRKRLKVAGVPVVVIDDVMQALNGLGQADLTGALQVAISSRGTLVYLRGGTTPDAETKLMWLDRQGKATEIPMTGAGAWFSVRLSPDERSAVVTTRYRGMHVVDLTRGTMRTLPESTFQLWAIWSQDGKRVIHNGRVGTSAALVSSVADGSQPARGLVGDTPIDLYPAFWSTDGTTLFGYRNEFRSVDVASGRMTTIASLAATTHAVLSPDGKWLAYSEPEGGSTQVFVQPWPALDRKWKVSTDGGSAPVWTRNGTELVYLKMMARDTTGVRRDRVLSVTFRAGAEPNPQPPRELFTASIGTGGLLRSHDVTRDGMRFLVLSGKLVPAPPDEPRIIANWFSELRRLSVPKVLPE